jgi:hypothetical protein
MAEEKFLSRRQKHYVRKAVFFTMKHQTPYAFVRILVGRDLYPQAVLKL